MKVLAFSTVVVCGIFAFVLAANAANPNCPLDPRFQEATLAVGAQYYTDRSYTISSVPSQYAGMDMIKLPNDDQTRTDAADYLVFKVASDQPVFVAFDRRTTNLPDWMGGFVDTGDQLGISGSSQPYLKIYRKDYQAGTCANFGANRGPGWAGSVDCSNYLVFRDTALPTTTTTSVPITTTTGVPTTTTTGVPTTTTTLPTTSQLLRWIIPPEPDVAGYNVYLAPASMDYTDGEDIGFHAPDPNGVASHTLTGLAPGVTRWVVMTAYDTSGNESAFSNEITIQPEADSDPPNQPLLQN